MCFICLRTYFNKQINTVWAHLYYRQINQLVLVPCAQLRTNEALDYGELLQFKSQLYNKRQFFQDSKLKVNEKKLYYYIYWLRKKQVSHIFLQYIKTVIFAEKISVSSHNKAFNIIRRRFDEFLPLIYLFVYYSTFLCKRSRIDSNCQNDA